MFPFGETVLLWRTQRGLTQNELATQARLTRPNLVAIEQGARDVTLKTVRNLALALATTPGALVDGQSPHGPPVELSRTAMERIARAAVQGKPCSDAREDLIAGCLRTVTGGCRGEKAFSGSKHGAALAYLHLKGLVKADELKSLLERVAPLKDAT